VFTQIALESTAPEDASEKVFLTTCLKARPDRTPDLSGFESKHPSKELDSKFKQRFSIAEGAKG
jgi:hypothetical protein